MGRTALPARQGENEGEAGDGRSWVPCREVLGCFDASCPAYGNGADPCWRLKNTRCAVSHGLGSDEGLETCLLCPVLRVNGEKDERGWNLFLSDELPYLNASSSMKCPESEWGFLTVAESLPYGLIVTDADQKVCYLNPVAERIIGLSARLSQGKRLDDLIGLGVAQLFKACNESDGIEDGSARSSHCSQEVTLGDGLTVLISRYSLIVPDPSNVPRREIFLLEDITPRKHLEDRLKYFEGEYLRIFEGSKDMIFVHSKGSIFSEVNQACVETLGYGSREELLSLRSVERIYVNPIHRKVFQEQIDRNGFVKDFETSFWKKDGSRIHCLVSGTAIRDREGRITGYEAIAKDITARMDGVRHLLQQHRELSLLHSVAAAMNVTHDLDEILATALKKVLESLNLTMGCVFLVDQEEPNFLLRVHQGFPDQLFGGHLRVRFHDHALMHSLLRKDVCIKQQCIFPPFKVNLKCGLVSLELVCFLITTKEKASGFLALSVPCNRTMTDHDHQMLGALGNFLGSAIENARLVQTIQRHREELRQLTARLFYSQEEERKRIAQELHDEVGSSLTGINFALETVENSLSAGASIARERILDIKKQINRTYQEMRRISHRLHPAVLSALGLEPALEACLTRISKYSQIEIDFRMVGFEGRLDPEIETVLYRISQEAINNTLKHAEATRFKLSIVKSYPNIILLAEDDGKGFDSGLLDEKDKRALGLVVMRERAAMLGGKFKIRSSRVGGTRIRVEIPIMERALG